jgi:hypothetical protein
MISLGGFVLKQHSSGLPSGKPIFDRGVIRQHDDE